ncbi:MAG: DUF2231 domain-containing protein [Verrucomicrobiae bacterium]
MLPDPLHPAIVHFPIVLLLLGAPLALFAVFVRKWNLPVLVAIVLSLGSAGAVVATVTGGKAAEMAGELPDDGELALDRHEGWGKRARIAAVLASALAILSAALVRKPAAARMAGAVAAIAAVAAAFSVAQAGHYGGQMVYKYGVGVNASASVGGASTEALQPKAGEEKPKKADND